MNPGLGGGRGGRGWHMPMMLLGRQRQENSKLEASLKNLGKEGKEMVFSDLHFLLRKILTARHVFFNLSWSQSWKTIRKLKISEDKIHLMHLICWPSQLSDSILHRAPLFPLVMAWRLRTEAHCCCSAS